MRRLGLSRSRVGALPALDIAPTRQEIVETAPRPAEVFFEIGVLLASHLAIVFAVLLTLQAFGLD